MKDPAAAFHFLPDTPGVYVVGGAIRDVLLGRTPADVDVVAMTDPGRFARRLAGQLNGRMVKLGKTGFPLYRVIAQRNRIDVSPPEGDNIEADLARRDFTVNAIAYEPATRRIIDGFGGLDDMTAGRLRMVSPDAFRADPVRLIRAFRIGAQTGFRFDPPTISAIRADAGHIQRSAGERVRRELLGMLQSPLSAKYLKRMSETGLLFHIFPELRYLVGCGQRKPHHADAYRHTLQAVQQLEAMMNRPDFGFPLISTRQLRSEMNGPRRALLKLTLLLHDVGKPRRRSEDRNGRIRFFGHCRKGAEMAGSICRRLKMSRRETAHLVSLIGWHIRPMLLFSSHVRGTLSKKGIARFFLTCGRLSPDLLIHGVADMKGKNPADGVEIRAFTEFSGKLLEAYYDRFVPRSREAGLLNGRDLMLVFGLEPSPRFGRILAEVETKRLSGELQNRGDALNWVAGRLGAAVDRSAQDTGSTNE